MGFIARSRVRFTIRMSVGYRVEGNKASGNEIGRKEDLSCWPHVALVGMEVKTLLGGRG